MNEAVDQQLWIDWQNAKAKGLASAKSFIRCYWAIDKKFTEIDITQTTLNALLKGVSKTREELRIDIFKNVSSAENPKYTVFMYRVIEEEIEDYFHIVD